ncbi:hypothetical protein [Leuconostoc pseudomesenteroides]|uniref:hypothetical protein n=1 Tax=Leuconostoc pseudomesenteroides TaxID=33968 RepID=UPI00403758FB
MFPRPNMNPAVLALFSKSPFLSDEINEYQENEENEENICHIFSWAYMNNVMTNFVKKLPTYAEGLDVWSGSLQCFVNSICLSMYDDDVDRTRWFIDQLGTKYIDSVGYSQTVENFRAESQRTVNILIEYAQQYTSVFLSSHGSATGELRYIYDNCYKLSDHLLDVLCSMPTNLKKGDASWNQSIGAAFDPRSWMFSEKSCYINNTEFLTWDVSSQSKRPAIVEQFHCELTNPVDQEQIMWAFRIDERFVEPTYLYTGIYVNQDVGKDVMTVCSSSNPFARVNTKLGTQRVPIYAYDRWLEDYVLRY